MIRITCSPSPLTMLPIRALLQLLAFTPKESRPSAAYAVIYPFSAHYRRAIKQLSYVEYVSDAQFLGITSQWRVRRWFNWLARTIAPLLEGNPVTFYGAEHIDNPTRLFLRILSMHASPESITLVKGKAKVSGGHFATATSYAEPEELKILEALLKNKDECTDDDNELLLEAGTGAVLSANYWQADVVFRALVDTHPARVNHALGLVHRFYEQGPAAEWYLLRATNGQDPIVNTQVRYALAILHLRFHERHHRSLTEAEFHLDAGLAALDDAKLPHERRTYSQVMLDAARALLKFRRGELTQAMALCDSNITRLETLPDNDRKVCCHTYTLGNKAQVLRAMGDIKGSSDLNKRLVKLDPQLPFWWVEYTKCLLELREYDTARVVLDEAVALHFDDPAINELQGQYFAKIGQHARSGQAFEKSRRYADVQNVVFDGLKIA